MSTITRILRQTRRELWSPDWHFTFLPKGSLARLDGVGALFENMLVCRPIILGDCSLRFQLSHAAESTKGRLGASARLWNVPSVFVPGVPCRSLCSRGVPGCFAQELLTQQSVIQLRGNLEFPHDGQSCSKTQSKPRHSLF